MGTSPGSKITGLLISGRYRIRRKLGSGSMGTVYLAMDEGQDRLVALKLIRKERLDPEGLDRLQREFQALSALHHDQFAAAYDFGYTAERLPFYTREYIDGAPLAPGPPPAGASPPEFLGPFFDLLHALEYLHAHEILHLDIHAGNLVVANDRKRGGVLIDFGLMRPPGRAGSTALLLQRWPVAPELLGGEPVGTAADLYAVGRLLLYRLTGNPEGEARLPREIPGWGPRLTLELERLAAKALQQDPGQRFPSAVEFREALSAVLGEGAGRRPSSIEPGEITHGRDQELEAIEQALREGALGDPAALWFVGPRGIGKSRLLAEAKLRAQLRGMALVEARFLRDSRGSPVLRAALRTSHRRPGLATWLAPLATEHGGSTLERARRTAKAYFMSEGPPLVLVLDDLEDADRESQLLAEALLEESLRRKQEGCLEKGMVLFLASATRPGPAVETSCRRAVRVLKPLSLRKSMDLLSKFLRPLRAPRFLLERFARVSHGHPLRLRQMARALHSEWQPAGAIPREARLPELEWAGSSNQPVTEAVLETPQGEVLRILSVLGRPATRDEIAAAAALPLAAIRKDLRRLVRAEVLSEHRRGRSRLYQIAGESNSGSLVPVPARDVRRIHFRMVRYLSRISAPLDGRVSLARHLLALGKLREGRRVALEAAARLRGEGLLDGAVRLLTEFSAREPDRTWRLRLLAEASSILEQAGDHAEGVSLLEPVYRSGLEPRDSAEAVRLRRRLGVHYHRAGFAEPARKLFAEVRAIADPRRDLEELIFVDSELAELHTLRGEYAEAEAACRRGLDLLAGSRGSRREFRCRMEVTLRASLGHLHLRRLALDRAAKEFATAARLSRTFGTTTLRALILNNLGIVHDQRNSFPRACACFRGAERLLLRSGERRIGIPVACNLATIAAKTGDAASARECLERATRWLAHYPGKRLEFQVTLARGMVAHFLGHMALAAEAFERALPMGRELGDAQFVGFAEVYLAEARLACGRYREALDRLQSLVARPGWPLPAVLERMARTRLFFLETLLGRRRAAARSRAALAAATRSGIPLLEAWNDLFLAFAGILDAAGGEGGVSAAGREVDRLLAGAARTFRRFGVPAGWRFARIGHLYQALYRTETQDVRKLLQEIDAAPDSGHKVLSVLEPLAGAEAFIALGETESARACLDEAGQAIVGLPLLELDWRIESLRALLAEREGDRDGARRFLHRSLHTRDLLVRTLLPAGRKAFLSHPRFVGIQGQVTRLQSPRITPVPPDRAAGEFHGMIGRSLLMSEVFKTIGRVRDQEIPVLITGETGTGKELVARAIHQTSPRRRGPFFALHCASLPGELFESEVFGHEAGAFTGADEPRAGLLEHLSGGTLLLDEVTSLAPATQMKFLRVLDSGVVRPLGSLDTRPIDVRFLASTSDSIEKAIADGVLRRDLYFRLRGVEIHLPPLRSRKEDIPLLVEHFLKLHARRLERAPPLATPEVLRFLAGHDWPGNVRELETTLLRILMTSSPGSPLAMEALRPLIPRAPSHPIFSEDALSGRDLKSLRRELDRVYLTRLFRDTRGDVRKMTETLGVKASRLYAWLREAGVDIQSLRREL